MSYCFDQSVELLKSMSNVIPGGGIRSRRFLEGNEHEPLFFHKGYGSRCIDVDQNEYIDYLLGFGALVLGHAHPLVIQQVIEAVQQGHLFSHCHPIQEMLARRIISLIPCAEQVYFFKTGSCATSAAVRVARAFTGNDIVIRCGYHGWHDWSCTDGTTNNLGVPRVLKPEVLPFSGSEIDDLVALFESRPDQIACVIVAPEELPVSRQGEDIKKIGMVISKIRDLAHHYGALFILDEIKTGFRLALGGIQELVGVTPDLATFSKALSNGFPLSILVGKQDVMQYCDKVHLATTLQSESLSMFAALKTLDILVEQHVVNHLWGIGDYLIKGVNDLLNLHGIEGRAFGRPLPPMPVIRFAGAPNVRNQLGQRFAAECIKRGVLIHGTHVGFVSAAHTVDDVDFTLERIDSVLRVMKSDRAFQVFEKI